jgi:SNF2 family DNA or RNA helicase
LFSTLRDNFRAIQSLLRKADIPWGTLYGAFSDEKTIAQFRKGAVKVLFLSAKQPGTGLNLEFVTDLILYHEIPPSREAVLVSRAHRIGRSAGPLRIHHLKLV